MTVIRPCKKCGADLNPQGYCQDVTCPYSNWPQKVLYLDLLSFSADGIFSKYGIHRRESTQLEGDKS